MIPTARRTPTELINTRMALLPLVEKYFALDGPVWTVKALLEICDCEVFS